MQYTSPIRTLNLDAFATHDKSSLTLAKKKLLAELELSGKATILRGGKELTKDDILKLFDSLVQDSNWEKHVLIAQDADLLAFLENGELSPEMTFSNRAAYDNAAFVAFVSPYFAASFKKQLLLGLENRALGRLKKLYEDVPNLMTAYDRSQAEFAAEEWVANLCNAVEIVSNNIAGGDYLANETLTKFTDDRLINCLNYLGDFLESQRDNLALALYNLSTELWNRFFRKKAGLVVVRALKLHCNPFVVDNLRERQAYFQENKSDTWIVFYWNLYHLTFLNKKPTGIVRVLTILVQLIAVPVVFSWRYWVWATNFLDRYILGRLVSTIGNFILALSTFGYTIFLCLGVFITLAIGSDVGDRANNALNTPKTASQSSQRAFFQDMPLVIISLQDSVKLYESRLNASKTRQKEALVNQSFLNLYQKRKNLYERAYAQHRAIGSQLMELAKRRPNNGDDSAKKAYGREVYHTVDAMRKYQLVLNSVVYHNATIRDLAHELRARDKVKYKNINWNNLEDSVVRRKAKIAFDSIAYYDVYLRDFLLENHH